MTDLSLDDLGLTRGVSSDSLLSLGQSDRSLTPTEEATQEVADQILNRTEMNRVLTFDPSLEVIKAGAAFEKKSTDLLSAMEKDSNASIAMIDLLLDLSKEAGALDSENPKITEKMRGLIDKLKENGLSILDISEGEEIDKDRLTTLKSTIGSHIDKLRTQIQQIFTKMQTVIQNMSSVNDTIKKMISEQADLIRKILDRSIKH